MPERPTREQQIRQFHARFINAVVEACLKPDGRAALEPLLQQAEAAGWNSLAAVIRRIAAGDRTAGMLGALDDEDRVIAASILEGMQNPASLPDPDTPPDGTMAAPGLAAMVHAAARGDAQALHLLGNMGEQMSRVGGDMARVAAILRRLLNGERDPDKLTRGMGKRAEGLTLSLLEELGKLETH